MPGRDDWRLAFEELLEALRSGLDSGPLAGFSQGQRLGSLSSALVRYCVESAKAFWVEQMAAGQSLVQVSAVIARLGLADLNIPLTRELQAQLEKERDVLVSRDDAAFQAILDKVSARVSRARRHGHRNQFVKNGEWVIRFAGKETILGGNLKGLAVIHYLIQNQGRAIHVVRLMTDLAGAERRRIDPAAEGLAIASRDVGELVDQEASHACHESLKAFEAEREYADANRRAEIDAEVDMIKKYLSGSRGLGGKRRKAGDTVANIRRRFARVIEIAIGKIHPNDPDLAIHLRNSIRTGIKMAYIPDRKVDWVL